MKTKCKVGQIMDFLSPEMKDAVYKAAKETGQDVDELKLKRAPSTAVPANAFSEGEDAVIQIVSTRGIDRENEILDPRGADLSQFRKAPSVLWGHDYSQLPIGSDERIWRTPTGIMAKTIYASTPFAQQVFTLRKEGHLRTSSVGFIPLEWSEKGSGTWEKTMRHVSAWPEMKGKDLSKLIRVHQRWMVLEHSDVPVPANPEALQVAISKGLVELSDEMIETLKGLARVDDVPTVVIDPKSSIRKGYVIDLSHFDMTSIDKFDDEGNIIKADDDGETENKGVLTFAIHGDTAGKQEPDARWNTRQAVSRTPLEDMPFISAWVNDKDEEITKESYKFIHHSGDAGHPANFKGVMISMSEILDPANSTPLIEKQGVHAHLVKHFEEFGETAPELKDYTEAEFKALYPPQALKRLEGIGRMEAPEPDPREKSIKRLTPDETMIKRVDAGPMKPHESMIKRLPPSDTKPTIAKGVTDSVLDRILGRT